MRAIFVLVALLLTANAQAGKLSANDKQYCDAVSSYAWNIIMNRFQHGIQKDQQWAALRQMGEIHESLNTPLNKIIEVVYRDDFPIPESAADVAFYTIAFKDDCLKQLKDQ